MRVAHYPAIFYLFMVCCLGFHCATAQQQGDSQVRFLHDKVTDKVNIIADNDTPAAQTVRLEFSLLENLRPVGNTKLPITLLIPPNVKNHPLIALERVNRGKAFKYSYKWSTALGDAFSAFHDDNHLYYFPFPHGTKYMVTQEFYGKISHHEPGTFFAVDFEMPEGDTICAARKGKVIRVRENYTEGGRDPELKSKANIVIILHDDGTLGEYGHIKHNGVLVEVGQSVKAGQPIAQAGNTGFSNGAHLDFKVSIPSANGKIRSLPIRFRGKEGTATRVSRGTYYYSYHENGEPFDAFLGTSITNQTFANHRAKVPYQGNKLDLRREKYDGTFVFYVRNYDNQPKTATFTLKKSENIKPSFSLPYSIKVGPMEERYFLFLRPSNAADRWNYDYNVNWK